MPLGEIWGSRLHEELPAVDEEADEEAKLRGRQWVEGLRPVFEAEGVVVGDPEEGLEIAYCPVADDKVMVLYLGYPIWIVDQAGTPERPLRNTASPMQVGSYGFLQDGRGGQWICFRSPEGDDGSDFKEAPIRLGLLERGVHGVAIGPKDVLRQTG